jgi:hypothetical protein
MPNALKHKMEKANMLQYFIETSLKDKKLIKFNVNDSFIIDSIIDSIIDEIIRKD